MPAPADLPALVADFLCHPGPDALRSVLAAARAAGCRAGVRAHLIERLEAAGGATQLLCRLYLEDGQGEAAAAAARRAADPAALVEVADGLLPGSRGLALQLYLEAVDLLAGAGGRAACARAAHLLALLRAAWEGEEGRWTRALDGLPPCAGRRALIQELRRAGLEGASLPLA
jgi:hypothetical protein